MKKFIKIFMVTIILISLSGCNTAAELDCGEGTTLSDGACVPTSSLNQNTGDQVATTCDNGPGAHQVVNSEFLNAPAEPWFFIGGWMVSQPDSIWMEEFDALIFDVTDAALAERNVWDGAFWQPKVYMEAGCTYTLSFTLRTDEVDGREVILFLEDTDNNYFKFIEETVTLGIEYQTFTYVYEAAVTNNDSKIGIFFANDVGTVIIDSIIVERSLTE